MLLSFLKLSSLHPSVSPHQERFDPCESAEVVSPPPHFLLDLQQMRICQTLHEAQRNSLYISLFRLCARLPRLYSKSYFVVQSYFVVVFSLFLRPWFSLIIAKHTSGVFVRKSYSRSVCVCTKLEQERFQWEYAKEEYGGAKASKNCLDLFLNSLCAIHVLTSG